jgi:hypothetical protein
MFDGELTECPHLQRAATLPPGIWAMSWADFWTRYGYNSRRANLLSGLMFALKLLVRSNCQTIYIGGSFITNKERPNDIDGCFDGMGIDNSALDPIFQDIDEQHARFGCELRMDFMSAFQGFLQKNRDGEAIGIVEIDLKSFDITR